MEITSFIMGVLTIVAIVFAIALIVGLLTISKLNKLVLNLSELERDTTNALYRDMQSMHDDIQSQFEKIGRDVTMVERTVMNQIDNTQQEFIRQIGQLQEDCIAGKRYTDSRIDKLVDTYFTVKVTEQNTKQLIKG